MSQESGSAEYRLGLGISANAVNQQDFDSAAEHFFKALQLGAPEFETDWIGWGSLKDFYLDKEDYNNAWKACQHVLTFDEAMQIPAVAGEILARLSHLALLRQDINEAIDFANKALAVQEIPEEYKCEAFFFRGKGIATQVKQMWQNGNRDTRTLVSLTDEAISSLRSCLGLSVKMEGGSRAKTLGEQAPEDIMNLQGFRKSIKGGCFIATAVYGSPYADEIMVLQEFRDNHLLKYKLGKAFVKLYYWLSPSLANQIAKRNCLKEFTKTVLIIPLVVFANNLIKKGK